MADAANSAAAGAGGELVIDFGWSGNSTSYRRSGWAEPEPRYTWTLGRESTLEFPRPALPGAYKLMLKVSPFVWRDRLRSQHLSVAINNQEVGAFVITGGGSVECAVPWSLIARSDWVSVTLSHPDAARPIDVNRVPDHREIALAFETVTLVCECDHRIGVDDPKDQAPHGTDPSAMPIDQLMMQFESLGENCEFGLAQRRCGAEPLGLLRFASTPLAALLTALKHRFDDFGDPERIELRISPDRREYLVLDRRYGILYHPWLLVGEAAPEDILAREAKRLPLLTRKLIEDLEEGRKIFVYRGMQPLSRVLMSRLVEALRGYGRCTLLWVERQDATHPPGTVEVLAEELLKGYIDRFAPAENAHDLSLDGWIALCQHALSIARQAPGS
jgi:hypothetical protein